jgi:hypothetical protein
MAKKSSSYQAAAQTRERGLLGNITDNLISGNGSIAGSIGRGISSTFKAKVTGIKEKFDPLNIAKKLTGNVGSAILGRATGRSREDMEHFAGRSPRSRGPRNAPAHQYTKTGPDLGELSKALHTKVSEGQQPKLRSGDSISNVLAKIYNLFLINSKADSDARDEDKQKKIEENELKEKRNAEIIKALTGTGKAVPVKEKKEQGKSFLEMIGSMISGLIGTIKGMIETALSPFKWLLNLDWLPAVGKIVPTLLRVAGFFISPFGLAILAAGSLLALLAADKNPEQTSKGIQSAGSDSGAFSTSMDVIDETTNIERRKQKLLSERPSNRKTGNFLENKDLEKKYLKEIGFDETTGLTKEETATGYVGIDDSGKPIKGKVKEGPNISATEKAGQQLPAAGQGTYDIGPVKANASTGEMSVKVNRNRKTTAESATTPTVQQAPVTATPTSPEPSSIASRMIDATTNNTETKLNENTSPKMISIDNSKKMSVGSSAPAIGMDSSVSVRIDDPTLQKLQKQNLRTV